MNTVLAITLLLTKLCTGQSITAKPTTLAESTILAESTTPAFVYEPGGGCGICEIAVATAPPYSSSSARGISTATPTASYIVFTAYSITSAYSSDVFCVTTSGSPITVSPYFSIQKPASISASDFLSDAGFSFVDFLGFSTCSGSGVQVTATALVDISSLPTNSPPSANATSIEPPVSSTEVPIPASQYHRLDEQAKIGIGIAIPVAVVALLLLALLLWRRSRKIKKANALEIEQRTSEERLPYLQQKAELEAKEKGKYELEAKERRYELDEESRIHEMSEEISHGRSPTHRRQELRGEDHSRELEVS